MKKILNDYIVIASNDRATLSNIIREYSIIEYELHGSAFVHDEGKGQGQEICQAMVKYEQEQGQ